ncbi:MAG: hypothetical protein LBI82_04375 [Dysgonamonadaceae bacterium]|jgi:hypothetical protein|nr:hypothetical protein [Dysgonamonadaceae bacterium]
MEIISNKQKYFELIKDFEYVPFNQSEGWYSFHAYKDPERIIFIVDSIENPTIACFAHVKKFLWLKLLMIEGECFHVDKISHQKIREFYSEITTLNYDMIEINSFHVYDHEYVIGIRQAGYLRPVGMFSTPNSILVDLQKSITYNRNWRRNLETAQKSNLKFEIIPNPDEKEIETFAKMYRNLTEDKKFSSMATEKQISVLLEDTNFSLGYVVGEQDCQIHSGIIFYKKRDYSVGVFAAKKEIAKKNGATFFMYDELFSYLRNHHFSYFDMAKITPSTHSKNNIFLFKNGIKGRYVLYAGEWAWYKNSLYRVLMYFVKKHLLKRIEV